jgi:hypothetical protein
MSVPPDSRSSVQKARPDLLVTSLAGAGPLLWFAVLVVAYALCAEPRGWNARLVSGAIVGLAALGNVLALVKLVRMAKTSAGHGPGAHHARASFMRWGGVALNVLVLLLLAGLCVPLLLQEP